MGAFIRDPDTGLSDLTCDGCYKQPAQFSEQHVPYRKGDMEWGEVKMNLCFDCHIKVMMVSHLDGIRMGIEPPMAEDGLKSKAGLR